MILVHPLPSDGLPYQIFAYQEALLCGEQRGSSHVLSKRPSESFNYQQYLSVQNQVDLRLCANTSPQGHNSTFNSRLLFNICGDCEYNSDLLDIIPQLICIYDYYLWIVPIFHIRSFWHNDFRCLSVCVRANSWNSSTTSSQSRRATNTASQVSLGLYWITHLASTKFPVDRQALLKRFLKCTQVFCGSTSRR